MSIFNDKALKSVAEAAAKIMAQESHGTEPKTEKEKSLAALAHPKDKITHKDVLVGRGVLKKEETEIVEGSNSETERRRKELLKQAEKFEKTKPHGWGTLANIARADAAKLKKEETEIDEGHQVVAKTKQGETFRSAVYPTKEKALGMHYKMSKSGKYKSIDTVKTNEEVEQIDEGSMHGKRPRKSSRPGDAGREGKVSDIIKKRNVEIDKKRDAKLKLSKEEVEQIDELSKGTLKNYVKAASSDIKSRAHNAAAYADTSVNSPSSKEWVNAAHKQWDKANKRVSGISKAINKLAKEEVEQIDELKKTTLQNYLNKRSRDFVDRSYDAIKAYAAGDHRGSKVAQDKADNSELGMKRATRRLVSGKVTKEEVEQIDELSKDTLKSYVKKASDGGKTEFFRKHAIAKAKQKIAMKEEVELEEELTAWQKVQRKKEEMEDKRRERMERENMPEPEKKKPTTQKVAGHRYGGSKQKDETNEETLSFTQMLESYTERGLKALSGFIKEEPDNEQWTKELKDQEATAAGKKKPASVAAPSTMGVKTMKEEDELTLEDFTPEEIEEFMQSEEYEQLDELSKSTLGSYIRKAASSARNRAYVAGSIGGGTGSRPNPESVKQLNKSDKRVEGIRRASRKMEEDVELSEGENEQMKGKDPCWKGYEMVGTKKKGGKEVPNCVPANRAKGD